MQVVMFGFNPNRRFVEKKINFNGLKIEFYTAQNTSVLYITINLCILLYYWYHLHVYKVLYLEVPR